MSNLLVFCGIVILLVSYFVEQPQELLNHVIQTIQNLIPLSIGITKFGIHFFKFRASEVDDITPKNRQQYDFIIIGAGSAGATIANRLTEIADANVLLIEAGNQENIFMDIPLTTAYISFLKNKQWDYTMEPSNDYCLGLNNKQCKMSIGKGMGGSSSVNFMMATRGTKNNYDTWANLTGDESWSYNGMLKYFKKLENYNVNLAVTIPEAHGYKGPVNIVNAPYQSSLAHAFVKSGKELGLPTLIDFNSGQQTGFAYMQTNQINGERMSTNRAYLHPIKSRKNLFVSMNSHVNKILIDAETKTAYGVEFTKDNEKIEVIAKKEVIICAGAIGSPKILMLSGIGPKEHLQSFNINVLQDAPVGENLMDHIMYVGLSFMTNETESIVISELVLPSNLALSDYLTRRTGIFTTATGVEGIAFLNVDDMIPENEEPNVEVFFAVAHFGSDLLFHQAFGMNSTYFYEFFGNTISRHGYGLFPVLLQPKSRGKVYLRSANPEDNPKIFGNYLSDPDDVRVGIKMIRAAIGISKTESMQKYGSIMNDAVVPGCESHEPNSDSYWECALRIFTATLWHHSGTCKMGRENDQSTVVNSKLQVKGIKNLRVADASVMPMIPAAHTNIPTIALAEKASDLIKSHWGYVD